jgi:hypothetical protein
MRKQPQSIRSNASNFRLLKEIILGWLQGSFQINLAGLTSYLCQLIKDWLISSGHHARLNKISKDLLLRSICIITSNTIEKLQEKTISSQISAVCAIITEKMCMISFHSLFMSLSVLEKLKKTWMSL